MKKPGIPIYEKKHAYKCMTKTRIQTRIQMYEIKRMKMFEKKQAYQCMEKNTHTNV